MREGLEMADDIVGGFLCFGLVLVLNEKEKIKGNRSRLALLSVSGFQEDGWFGDCVGCYCLNRMGTAGCRRESEA